MKAFFCVVVFGFLLLTVKAGMNKPELIEHFRKDAADCVTKTGASADDLEDIIKHLPASNMNAKCLRACIMKKHGSMTEEGKMALEVTLQIAEFLHQDEPDKIALCKEVIKACENHAVSDDHCEASEDYINCFKAEGTARGVNADDF